MKRLLFRFLLFLGFLSVMGRVDFMVVVVGVGVGMACMALLHFWANPDSIDSTDSAAS